MIDWVSDAYVRLILNLRILLDNPTENETVVWLRFLSLLLAGVVMLRFAVDQFASRRLRKRSKSCDNPDVIRLVDQAAEGLGLKKPPRVFFSERTWPLAFSHGIAKPAIFLAPVLLDRLSTDELRAVITHESAHFRRWDSLQYWLRELLWVLLPLLLIQGFAVRFVFNAATSQLVWWGGVALVLGFRLLYRPWDRIREKACDDQTLAVTEDPHALARALLTTNRLGRELAVTHRNLEPISAHAFFRGRSSLQARVVRLVDYRRPRFGQTARHFARTGLAVVATGFLLFSVLFHSSEENRLLIESVWAAPCPSVLLVD